MHRVTRHLRSFVKNTRRRDGLWPFLVAGIFSSGCVPQVWHDPNGETAPDDDLALCDGLCAPPPEPANPTGDEPTPWQGPSVFAIGPSADLPACPPEAPHPGIEAHADLQPAPHSCPACTCDPSETTCTAPTEWHVAAAKCDHTEMASLVPFPAPADWTGACANQAPIPPNAMCGGEPCAQSVIVTAPQAQSAPCTPRLAGDPLIPPPSWTRRARECLASPEDGECEAPAAACLHLPGGFAACVHRRGEHACPHPYDERHLLHSAIDDTRACPPCTCGPPQGASCTVLAMAYTDSACGLLAGAAGLSSSDETACFDVATGVPLAGKEAELLSSTPGTCAPATAAPAGLVLPADPVTLCCLPTPEPR